MDLHEETIESLANTFQTNIFMCLNKLGEDKK